MLFVGVLKAGWAVMVEAEKRLTQTFDIQYSLDISDGNRKEAFMFYSTMAADF